MNNVIIAEANFITKDLYELYVGKKEFDVVLKRSLWLRLQTIRDEARKCNCEIQNEEIKGKRDD